MGSLQYVESLRKSLAEIEIREGQFVNCTDTHEYAYDPTYDVRILTEKLVVLNTNSDRSKAQNNNTVRDNVVYYVKENQQFYVFVMGTGWKNVITSDQIAYIIGGYTTAVPATLTRGENKYAPMTIASNVYTEDGETVEAKIRQIGTITSSFEEILVTKAGREFGIPIPYPEFFNNPHMLEVYIGTVRVYPNRYTIDGNTIIFQDEIPAGRTINFFFLYNTTAPRLGVMKAIDGGYIAKGTIPIDRMFKYSNNIYENDTSSVATSAAVRGLFDVVTGLMDNATIVTRCTTIDKNGKLDANLASEYQLLDGNVLLCRFHKDVLSNATLRVAGKDWPIYTNLTPVKSGQIHANDELALQFDAVKNVFHVTNGLPYVIDHTSYTYTSVRDGETNINYGRLTYNTGTDRMEVYYNGLKLIADKHYTFNTQSPSIDLSGWSTEKGDEVEFIVYRVVRSRAGGGNS